jgi:hypothetical protein
MAIPPYGLHFSSPPASLICPTGKSATACASALSSPVRKNISVFPKSNPLYIRRHPVPREGRIAIVTDVGHGMWWTRQRRARSVVARTRDACRGRRSRVVLTPRRWCQVGGGNSTNDGGKKARSPGRARSKPLKPLRREGRVNPVNLW